MRNSIALASLLLSILVNTAYSQCPNTNSCYNRTTPVRPCCQSSAKPACAIYPAHTSCCPSTSSAQGFPVPRMQCEPVVQSYSLVQSCPVNQSFTVPSYTVPSYTVPSYTVLQSYPPSSYRDNTYAFQSSRVGQIETIVLPQSPTLTIVSPQSAQQIAQQISQGNCNCNRAAEIQTFSPQASPQNASILEHKRNPFSLAGHARERRPPDFCAQEFLACCESGGKDCMAAYLSCAEVTGEQVRHHECPSDGIIDKRR